jgi:uncharacterized protein (DUF1697 family)
LNGARRRRLPHNSGVRVIAFLRAINVGGRHTVSMAQLRRIFEALGFKDVETFIASGNVIFTSRAAPSPAMQRRIEDRLRATLGFDVSAFIRTEAEVAAVAGYRPFDDSLMRAAASLNVGFLAEPLSPEATRALMALKTDIDDFHLRGREVYWICRKRQGASKMSNAVLEKALKVRSTFRGVNTVSRLAARYCVGPRRPR